eukprot:scaffold21750_cov128-Isochrysis_galbana.AAC.6
MRTGIPDYRVRRRRLANVTPCLYTVCPMPDATMRHAICDMCALARENYTRYYSRMPSMHHMPRYTTLVDQTKRTSISTAPMNLLDGGIETAPWATAPPPPRPPLRSSAPDLPSASFDPSWCFGHGTSPLTSIGATHPFLRGPPPPPPLSPPGSLAVSISASGSVASVMAAPAPMSFDESLGHPRGTKMGTSKMGRARNAERNVMYEERPA